MWLGSKGVVGNGRDFGGKQATKLECFNRQATFISFGFWLVIPRTALTASIHYVPRKLVSHAMNPIVGLEIEEKRSTKLSIKLWRCNNGAVRFSDKELDGHRDVLCLTGGRAKRLYFFISRTLQDSGFPVAFPWQA